MFSFNSRWVWSSEIAKPPQGGSGKHAQYDYAAITPSPVISGSNFTITYANADDSISGTVVQDTITVANVPVNMQFGAAQVVPGGWFYSDGLLALGWTAGNASTWEHYKRLPGEIWLLTHLHRKVTNKPPRSSIFSKTSCTPPSLQHFSI